MQQGTLKLGPHPAGFITNAAGKRTHAIMPILDATDPWDALPVVAPDGDDLAFLARFKEDPDSFLAPAPVANPIRVARLEAKVTQDVLARALGISAAALSKQEQEGHVPRPATLARALAGLARLRPKG